MVRATRRGVGCQATVAPGTALRTGLFVLFVCPLAVGKDAAFIPPSRTKSRALPGMDARAVHLP